MKQFLLISNVILFLMLWFTNCAEYSLVQKESNVALNLNSSFCLKPPEQSVRYSKISFVLDKSGSNNNTDPDKSRRFNAAINFINQFRDDPYYKWNVIVFNGGQARSLVNDGTSPIFSTSADAYAAMDEFNAEDDNNSTPYLSALAAVDRLIVDDIEMFPEEYSTYNVFFLSDGRPTDTQGCGEGDCGDIKRQISDLRSRDEGKVFLSTVYYYATTVDAIAARGLQIMAELGGGTYSNAGENEPIVFEEVKTGEKPDPWTIKGSQLMVYNLNSGFCADGSVDTDSDADGICDKDEREYNRIFADVINEKYPGKQFDPLNRNSFSDDYSDSFVWKFDLLQTSSGFSGCNVNEPDKDFDFLNKCEEIMLKDVANANGPTPEWTEFLKNTTGGASDPEYFDSDGDLFLDFIEFYQFKLESGISSSVDYLSIFNKYIGGVSAEKLMLQHKHFKRANLDLDSDYDISTYPLGINELGEQCYDFKLDPIMLYPTRAVNKSQVSQFDDLVHGEGENKVLVYFIATKEDDRHGRGILYYQVLNLKVDDPVNLDKHIKVENFKTYKPGR